MTAGNDFTIRIMLPEDGEKASVARTLIGWGQVTSFGQTIFSKRVSGEEAARVLSVLNSLGLEYSLSIDDGTKGQVEPSAPVFVGARPLEGEPIPRLRAQKARQSPRKLPRLAGWSVGTLAFFLMVILAAALMTTDRGGTPAANGSVGLFEDSFTDNRYGWIANETAGIDSGSYVVKNCASPKSVLVANERLSGRNLVAEVDVTILGGTKEGYAGLGYRVRNVENFYFFGVALDGSIAILRREIGFWSRMEPGGGIKRSGEGFDLKNSYHLRMVVKGMYSEFYVDGELITIVRDESFERGLFGFYVEANLDAAFDDLLLTFSEYESFDTDLSVGLR